MPGIELNTGTRKMCAPRRDPNTERELRASDIYRVVISELRDER